MPEQEEGVRLPAVLGHVSVETSFAPGPAARRPMGEYGAFLVVEISGAPQGNRVSPVK